MSISWLYTFFTKVVTFAWMSKLTKFTPLVMFGLLKLNFHFLVQPLFPSLHILLLLGPCLHFFFSLSLLSSPITLHLALTWPSIATNDYTFDKIRYFLISFTLSFSFLLSTISNFISLSNYTFSPASIGPSSSFYTLIPSHPMIARFEPKQLCPVAINHPPLDSVEPTCVS